MTIKEFYQRIGGNYEDILCRLPSDEYVLRFLLRFPGDGTYGELKAALETGDPTACIEAAHKLKGIAGNLSFTRLYRAVCALHEQLRHRNAAADPLDAVLAQQVEDSYQIVIRELQNLEADGAAL